LSAAPAACARPVHTSPMVWKEEVRVTWYSRNETSWPGCR
jgi:hypothetical protein